MRAKKPSGLLSVAGVVRLVSHGLMGAALGLVLVLALLLINPTVAGLLGAGGHSAALVFIAALVMTFAIGATLTGAIFIIIEDKKT